MNDIVQHCLVSGADGYVSVTPAGRVILAETAPALRGEDIDRIADDVGTDVALRTVAANGGTAAIIVEDDSRTSIVFTGRVAALIELPTAEWFVTPTGTDGHTIGVPGDALRFSIAIGATSPADVNPNTAATLSTPGGQPASQVVIDQRLDEPSDPTPVGLEVVDLVAAAEIAPGPLPLASQVIAPAPPAPAPAEPAAPGLATPAPSASPPTPPPAPSPAPGPGSAAAQSLDSETDGEDDDMSNWVLGIRCPLDHHNHPDAGYCSQCGRKMHINATAVLVKGPRPPLGLFLLDDGGAIPIATDLLIGRDAMTHVDVADGRRQAVLMTDTSNVVSRHHLAITLDEWTITVADLGSSNGTVFVDGKTGASQRLTPHQPVAMDSGDQLRIGPRTLHLELHHVAVPQ